MVQGIKLVTSEMIIGEVVEREDMGTKITLKDPFMMMLQGTATGIGVQLIPMISWMDDESTSFERKDIIYYFTPLKKIVNDYEVSARKARMEKSGLVLPNK